MSTLRASITSIGLTLLLAASGGCSVNTPATEGTGGSAVGGTTSQGGNQSGGSAGSQSGGTVSNPSGGSGGSSGGSASGGMAGSESGGSAAGGTAKGGSGGGGSGGSGGGGSGGSGSGGTAKGGTASGGSAAGGTTTTNNGGTTVQNGGSAPGGTQGTGGISAAGGATTPPANVLVTSASGSYWKTGSVTEVTSGTADVTVNDTAAQTWDGFGGAFNEKGWSVLTTSALQDEAMKLLFSADGANFAWGRIPIGASDYGMDRYTCNENAGDNSMSKFSISRDKEKLIPYIKAAQKVKSGLKFWASPWTPPTWMKDSPYLSPGNPVNAFDGGTMKKDNTTLQAFALYLVKFIQAYSGEGIKIDVISPQNEPGYAQNYPSCLWDATTYVNLIKLLGPALSSASVDAKVMLGTMSNNGDNSRTDLDIATAVMNDSTAKGIVKVFGAQWGVLDAVIGGKSVGLPVWGTEIKCGNYPWNPSGYPKYVEPAPNDQAYAVESWGYIRDAIKKGKVTSFNAWNMVLDKMGKGIDNTRQWAQNALLTVDGGKITQTPAYYVFRHISQFVDPGATVLGTSSNESVAFKNPDGSFVAVMYASSGKSNYIVKIGGKMLQFNMPSGGWATVKFK